jgi:hypothetical protein
MHAALKGYLEITILLLDKGADINQTDKVDLSQTFSYLPLIYFILEW